MKITRRSTPLSELPPLTNHPRKSLAITPPKAPSYNHVFKKPGLILIYKAAINIVLLVLYLSSWTLSIPKWTVKKLFKRTNHPNDLYKTLYQLAKKQNFEELEAFLNRHSPTPSVEGYLFKELSHLSELHPHLPQILQGANVCLNDGGRLFQRWKTHPKAYQRVSSHNCRLPSYALSHFLFWVDKNGHTRFQFEKTPLKGFFNFIPHAIDYLRYIRDNEQQGIAGTSPHTESNCLSIRIAD